MSEPYAALGPFSRQVLHTHMVRKSAASKTAFRAGLVRTLEEAGWPVAVESSGRMLKSHNVVAGSPERASLVLTAHYDTPARLPIPNFITPRCLPVYIAWQLLLTVLLVLPALAAYIPLMRTGHPLAGAAALLLLSGLAIFLLLAGPANPSNANDNTSGVLALLEIALALPPARRGHVALVFFDNEELGLVGAAAFRQKHGRLPGTLLLNFDCVGDGDVMLFAQSKACRKDEATAALLGEAFPARPGLSPLVDASPLTLYPSDQMVFERGVGVAALKKGLLGVLYVSRLHTALDVVLREENLLYLRDGALRLATLCARPCPENPGRPQTGPS